MSFEQTVDEKCYFLPEDGTEAHADFLELLHSPGETWICAYGFTDTSLIAEIKKADDNGIAVHLLLDHTQACGHAEAALVKDLAAYLKYGDVTITTAGIGSDNKSAIWHWKALVTDDVKGGEPWCWRGSVNWSGGGWSQGNEASRFRSAIWAGEFIKRFDAHRDWAKEHEQKYQMQGTSSLL